MEVVPDGLAVALTAVIEVEPQQGKRSIHFFVLPHAQERFVHHAEPWQKPFSIFQNWGGMSGDFEVLVRTTWVPNLSPRSLEAREKD